MFIVNNKTEKMFCGQKSRDVQLRKFQWGKCQQSLIPKEKKLIKLIFSKSTFNSILLNSQSELSKSYSNKVYPKHNLNFKVYS
jgi:hypothetical protein